MLYIGFFGLSLLRFPYSFLSPLHPILSCFGTPQRDHDSVACDQAHAHYTDHRSYLDNKSKPFTFLMDASMLGVGVGFDTKGAGKVMVKGVNAALPTRTFVIPDSREGWVDALRQLINTHLAGREALHFDYSKIRPFGTPIKGFGGMASGLVALQELLECVRDMLTCTACGSDVDAHRHHGIMSLHYNPDVL